MTKNDDAKSQETFLEKENMNKAVELDSLKAFQTSKQLRVFSNINAFQNAFPNIPKNSKRLFALEEYFSAKGIIKVYEAGKEWPKLFYPDVIAIERKLEEIKTKKKIYQEMLTQWKKNYSLAINYDINNQIMKLKEPVYWKHLIKLASDKDYREDLEKVKLPIHLIGDKKWKPMIRMFVNDVEYRKQLVETIQTSIAYKNDRRVAKYAEDLKEFRMNTSRKKIEEIEQKIESIKKLENALNEILKWAKEST